MADAKCSHFCSHRIHCYVTVIMLGRNYNFDVGWRLIKFELEIRTPRYLVTVFIRKLFFQTLIITINVETVSSLGLNMIYLLSSMFQGGRLHRIQLHSYVDSRRTLF